MKTKDGGGKVVDGFEVRELPNMKISRRRGAREENARGRWGRGVNVSNLLIMTVTLNNKIKMNLESEMGGRQSSSGTESGTSLMGEVDVGRMDASKRQTLTNPFVWDGKGALKNPLSSDQRERRGYHTSREHGQGGFGVGTCRRALRWSRQCCPCVG